MSSRFFYRTVYKLFLRGIATRNSLQSSLPQIFVPSATSVGINRRAVARHHNPAIFGKIIQDTTHTFLFRNENKSIKSKVWYVNYFFSLGCFVTSVVERLIGRCIARRRAKSGTNSMPPVIIHVRGLLYLHFWPFLLPATRFWFLDKFSLFWAGALSSSCKFPESFSCDFRMYFVLQSQKHWAQHCNGNFVFFTQLSSGLICVFSTRSFVRLNWQTSSSRVFKSNLSVQP